jgi:3' terminal RNA ribose 2'-O-methyltransferase Hen1
MLLEIHNCSAPADGLAWLLHKHPDKLQAFDLPFGTARVFYPEASEEHCCAALLLETDPIALIRRRGPDLGLAGYVNDRPYALSSFLSVAIARVFGSALQGRCKDRPELVDRELELEARLPVLPVRGGEALLDALFAPLGYEIEAERLPLDEQFAEWGESRYFDVRLRGTRPLRELLAHLYVLIPVLDRDKHYYIGEAEVDKLLRHGEGWLATHPERDQIARRYLRERRSLTQMALRRLTEEDAPLLERDAQAELSERELETPLRLNDIRMDRIRDQLLQLGAQSVLDLGCGEGRLLQLLLRERGIERIVGVDTTLSVLERAERRLGLEDMAPRMRQRIELQHGSVLYRDERFEGFDAIALVEVIEHVDPWRLDALEAVVFEHARARHVLVSTPNREFNARFEHMPQNRLRHGDHRFEWTRAEFRSWADGVAERHGYTVSYAPIGEEDPQLGPPTQLAVFSQRAGGQR